MLLFLVSVNASAQNCPTPAPAVDSVVLGSSDSIKGFSMGVTLDRYVIESYSVTAVSLRGVALTPSKWGSEFGFGLVPGGDGGNVGITTDLGLAHESFVSGAVILAKLGTTGVYSGGGGLLGFYGGGGVVARIAPGLAIRFDVTRRWFLADGPLPAVWLVSVGFSSLPTKR